MTQYDKDNKVYFYLSIGTNALLSYLSADRGNSTLHFVAFIVEVGMQHVDTVVTGVQLLRSRQ